MSSIFKKLNLKDNARIHVFKPPLSFEPFLEEISESTSIVRDNLNPPVKFILAFVTRKMDIKLLADSLRESLEEDIVCWVAYPKKSSKNFTSDITRDEGWQPFGDLGFEGVRMVSIDDDWSALRLRKAEYIKTMKRDPKWRMSKEGKLRGISRSSSQ